MEPQSGSTENRNQPAQHLNISSSLELHRFLRKILPEFLRVVYPKASGLIDIMYSAKLLTDTDMESLSGRDVNCRKDEARKLWFHLNNIPLHDFHFTVAPLLIEEYPHIIPDGFLTHEAAEFTISDSDDDCFHHRIRRRIRSASMADLLYYHERLELEDYGNIIRDEKKNEADIVWKKMFDLCKVDDHSCSQWLIEGLRALLTKYRVRVPENFKALLALGIPCTCNDANTAPPASPVLPDKLVVSWIKESPFDCRSTSSSSSSSYADKSYNRTTSSRDDDFQSFGSDDTLLGDVTNSPRQSPVTKLSCSSAKLQRARKAAVKKGISHEITISTQENTIPGTSINI